jgi:hypothetical protein
MVAARLQVQRLKLAPVYQSSRGQARLTLAVLALPMQLTHETDVPERSSLARARSPATRLVEGRLRPQD